jgi:hypothetical protein
VNILLVVGGVVLSLSGPLFGLIPLAVLTTRTSKKSAVEISEVFK